MENSRSPVVYLGIIAAASRPGASGSTADLLAVKEDGEIQCYDGESLDPRWTSPAAALFRDTSPTTKSRVEFAQLTDAYSASQGILRGRQDVLAIFPEQIVEGGFNPEILVIVTNALELVRRTLHIVRLPRRTTALSKGMNHSVDSLLTAEIPAQTSSNKTTFGIKVSAGILQQLRNNDLITFDLSDTLPKEQTKVKVPSAQSFLRLSNTAVMLASKDSICVYNPQFQSNLATVQLAPAATESLKRKRGGETEGGSSHSCKFISYFPKLGTAVAIVDNDLVAVQVEGQQDRHGRPRAAGLLVDSLGCSARDQTRPGREGSSFKKAKLDLTTLDTFLPGSMGLGLPWSQMTAGVERLFVSGTCDESEFDRKIEQYFGADWSDQTDASKISGTNKMDIATKGDAPGQRSTRPQYPPADVDRRWVLYALSKIFSWTKSGENEPSLSITFYPLKTFMWLTSHGYMTVANIEAALRTRGVPAVSIPAGQLVEALVETDPDMDLLYAVVAKNYLGASELLHAIRKLMGSLGLLGDNPGTKQDLLDIGDDVDIEEQVAKLQEEAEADLELAEHELGPGSGNRGAALSLALSKLYTCPSDDITLALQTTFTSQDIVCLIYLLRFELARGGWTTRYTDIDETGIVDEEAGVQDNAIILIASLLNNCIDAIGTVGWLSGDARLVDGDLFEAEELIASLKLEVSAALEGIEECVYLKGVLTGFLKYADSYQRGLPPPSKDSKRLNDAPVILASADEEIKALPIGLQAEKQISLLKIGAGGAIHKRTARDIGLLKSQKIGRYSREKIVL